MYTILWYTREHLKGTEAPKAGVAFPGNLQSTDEEVFLQNLKEGRFFALPSSWPDPGILSSDFRNLNELNPLVEFLEFEECEELPQNCLVVVRGESFRSFLCSHFGEEYIVEKQPCYHMYSLKFHLLYCLSILLDKLITILVSPIAWLLRRQIEYYGFSDWYAYRILVGKPFPLRLFFQRGSWIVSPRTSKKEKDSI